MSESKVHTTRIPSDTGNLTTKSSLLQSFLFDDLSVSIRQILTFSSDLWLAIKEGGAKIALSFPSPLSAISEQIKSWDIYFVLCLITVKEEHGWVEKTWDASQLLLVKCWEFLGWSTTPAAPVGNASPDKWWVRGSNPEANQPPRISNLICPALPVFRLLMLQRYSIKWSPFGLNMISVAPPALSIKLWPPKLTFWRGAGSN